MNKSETLKELEAKLKAIALDEQRLGKERQAIQLSVDALRVDMLFEGGLLSKHPWRMGMHGFDSFELVGQTKENKELEDLLFPLGHGNYHFSVDAGKGVEIRWNDNEVSIYAKKDKDLFMFIHTHKIKISFVDELIERKRLQDKMDRLDQVVAMAKKVESGK